MKLKNKEIAIIIILVLVVGGLSYYFGYFKGSDKPKACFDSLCFNVEIADEQNERTIGLMNRTTLGENEGMLFVWESAGYYPFWMKDTLIPLDMIWINADKVVVFIYEDARPCAEEPCEIIYPEGNAMYVLEINSGAAGRNGIGIGSKLVIK